MEFVTGGPTERRPPFHFSAHTRVWFSDTDAQGVVYYGRYLPYADHARHEYHRHLGLLMREPGDPEFVMRAMSIAYEAPARFDDLMEVFTRTTRVGRTSVTAECAAYRVADDRLMCTVTQTLVLVDAASRRPVPVPPRYRSAVAAFEGIDLGQSWPRAGAD
jgi:acyl-CoA thioester hydrolase